MTAEALEGRAPSRPTSLQRAETQYLAVRTAVWHNTRSMTPKTFFGELRRRNVLKVATTYVAIAWLLIESASLWRSTIGAPAGVIKALAAFLILGFALTIYISWAFEATPGGLKRTAKVSPEEIRALPSWSTRKFTLFIAATAFLAASLHLFHLLGSKP